MAFGFKAQKEEPLYIAQSSTGNNYVIKFDAKGDLRVNRKITDLTLSEENGFTYIHHKKAKYPVEIIEKHQNKYVILINGVSYNISVETPFSYKRKKRLNQQKAESKTEQIIAPMPGKIIEVLVEENTIVKEGDSIAILEAMKMQNEIVSHVTGKIKNIRVKAEETVNKDDVIVEIEK
jgi:biotin carboxyl carrier protein